MDPKWDEKVLDEMRRYKLDDITVDILGKEGYTTFDMIDILDVDIVLNTLSNKGITSAQLSAFGTMLKERRNRQSELHTSYRIHEWDIDKGIMSDRLKEIIRKHSDILCNNTSNAAFVGILTYLNSRDTLADVEVSMVKSIEHHHKQVDALLSYLKKKSNRAFHELVRALKKYGAGHPADYLIEDYQLAEHLPYNNNITQPKGIVYLLR